MTQPAATLRGEEGFSTLEILVAFVVLSIALAVAVQGVAQATSNLRRAGEDERAARMLKRLTAEELPPALEAAARGVLVREGAGWRIELEPLQDTAPSVTKVTLTIAPSGGQPRSYLTFAVEGGGSAE